MKTPYKIETLIILTLTITTTLTAITTQTAILDQPQINQVWRQKLDDRVYGVAWSPTGEYIAAGTGYWRGKSLYLFDREGNQVWRQKLDGIVDSVAWSPTGEYIAAGTRGESLYVFDREGNKQWQRKLDGSVLSVAWSPTGEYIAAGTGWPSYSLYLFDREGNQVWRQKLDDWVDSVAWSPTGEYIAAGTRGESLYVFDREGNKQWQRKLDGWVYSVAWSPTGKHIAAGVGGYSLYLFDREGNQVWRQKLDGDVYGVAWSPSGRLIAAGTLGDSLYLFDREGNQVWRQKLDGDVYGVAWSPSGRLIAAGTDGESLYVFEVGFGVLVVESSVPATLMFSWDGENITRSIAPGKTYFYLTPGGYTVEYRVEEPQDFIGDPEVLKGFLQVTVGVGETVGAVLPGYESLLGRLTLEAQAPAEAIISWDGGEMGLRLAAGDSLQLWATPGGYTVEYRVILPREMVGDPSSLRVGNVAIVTVATGSTVNVYLHNVLGLLRVEPPVSSVVTVSWESGSVVFDSPGVVEVPAAPGVYTVTIDPVIPLLAPVVLDVSVEAGSVASVSLAMGDMRPSVLAYSLAVSMALGGLVYFNYRVRPRVVVEEVEGEAVRGVGARMKITLENKGRMEWRGNIGVKAEGYKEWRGVVEVPGRSRRTIEVTLQKDVQKVKHVNVVIKIGRTRDGRGSATEQAEAGDAPDAPEPENAG